MYQEYQHGDYLISTDPARLDPAAIHAYLTRSYWAEGIPLNLVERSLNHSLCFGLYYEGQQVGLARVITDYTTYAYLCDVYVLEEHRGKSLGIWLIECVMKHPDLQGLRRFTLATRDAHSLYSRFGFEVTKNPERRMEIMWPDRYEQIAQEKP
jgi:GNAT superfamily N-acetyltransferase